MNSRFLSLIVVFASLFFLSVQPSFAKSHSNGTTRVRGNVYDQNNGGQGIGGLTVTVTCNGNTQTKVTDSYGLYVVDFTRSECPRFGPVSATVSHNGQSQSDTVYVSDIYTATMDFYFGATSVPEFGMIPGIIAAVGSIGAYLKLRKRQG